MTEVREKKNTAFRVNPKVCECGEFSGICLSFLKKVTKVWKKKMSA